MKKVSSITRPIPTAFSIEELKENLATHKFRSSFNAKSSCAGCGHKPWSREVQYPCGSKVPYQVETVWSDGTTTKEKNS